MTIEDRVDDIGDWRDSDARQHAIKVMQAAIKAAIADERFEITYKLGQMRAETDSDIERAAYDRVAWMLEARAKPTEVQK